MVERPHPEGMENWQAPEQESDLKEPGLFERVGDKIRGLLPYTGLLLLTSGVASAERSPAQEKLMMREAVQANVQLTTLEVFHPESVKINKVADPETGQMVEKRMVSGFLRGSDGLFDFYEGSPTNPEKDKGKDLLAQATERYKALKIEIEKKTKAETAKKIEAIIAKRMMQWGGREPSFHGHLPNEALVNDLMEDAQDDLLSEIDVVGGKVDSQAVSGLLMRANKGELEIARDFVGHWWQAGQKTERK